MKKMFTVFALLFAISASAQLSGLVPGRVQMVVLDFDPQTSDDPKLTFSQWIDGDTTIAGNSYKKCYIKVLPQLPGSFLDMVSGADSVQVSECIREDAGKVFMWDWALHADQLVFDYSIQVGDTMDFFLFHDTASFILNKPVLESIVTENMFGVDRRVYKFTDVQTIYPDVAQRDIVWIEGIGNIKGWNFAKIPYPTHIGSPSIFVSCAYDSLDQVYDHPDLDSCYYFYPLSDTVQPPFSVKETGQGLDLSVYPNPASHMLNIQASLPMDRIELLDLNGRVIAVFPQNKVLKTTVDLGSLPSGIYILKIVSGTKVGFRKQVVGRE